MSSHSFFLLNKKEFLLGRIGGGQDALTSSSMMACFGHLDLLGQYQKWMELRGSLLRKASIFDAVGIIMCWWGWMPELKIFSAAMRESIITVT